MVYNMDGTVSFTSIPDLQYDLFSEMGISIDRNTGYIYEQDVGTLIMLNGKYIKASMAGEPIYINKDKEVAFEPDKNYKLVSTIFGWYLDKAQRSEEGDILGGYIAHYIDDNPEKDKQRVVVKTQARGEISSNYYYRIYLAYFDCILRIAGYNPSLQNFDVLLVEDKPKK